MPRLPHRIILTISRMLYMDALFIVKQYVRGNNFTLSFEMIATTQFFCTCTASIIACLFYDFFKTHLRKS